MGALSLPSSTGTETAWLEWMDCQYRILQTPSRFLYFVSVQEAWYMAGMALQDTNNCTCYFEYRYRASSELFEYCTVRPPR